MFLYVSYYDIAYIYCQLIAYGIIGMSMPVTWAKPKPWATHGTDESGNQAQGVMDPKAPAQQLTGPWSRAHGSWAQAINRQSIRNQ